MEKIKKILIPTDGSECSSRAAETGISLAKVLGAEIYAIYAIDPIIVEELTKGIGTPDIKKELREKGEREPHDQIIHYAKTKGIDLIVMGTYGRRGTKRILIGSVTERVIEYAPCPVLVVR